MKSLTSEYLSKLKEQLKTKLPEVQVDSISSALAFDETGDTIYTVRGKGFSPVLIRSSSIEDALERAGPDGALKYIATKLRLAAR